MDESRLQGFYTSDDYLSINDFYKVYGYTCFYQSDTESVLEILPTELTVTIVNANKSKILEEKKMCEALREIFEEELKESNKRG